MKPQFYLAFNMDMKLYLLPQQKSLYRLRVVQSCSDETHSLVTKDAVMHWLRERPLRLMSLWDAYLSIYEVLARMSLI
jgi:hypothetical protein